MTDERLCIVCPALHPQGQPRHPRTMPVCDGCRAAVLRDLTGLPDGYAQLRGVLAPGQAGKGRGAPGFGSRMPANLGALDLLGPGAPLLSEIGWAETQLGHLPPLVLLDQWAANWVELRDMGESQPNATVVELVAWLVNRLDWALDNHPAVDEFAGDMSVLARSLRIVGQRDEPLGEFAGRCPMVMRDKQRCGTRLYVDPYVDQISCRRCGSTWDRRKGEWVKLRGQQLGMVA